MLEDLINEADGDENDRQAEREKKIRLEKAKNFFWFCDYYLPNAFPVDFAEYAKALIDVVSTRLLSKENEALFKSLIDIDHHGFIKRPNEGEELEAILDIEPRDHGKTTRNTQALPLWLALNFPGLFPVICAASKDSAEGMLDAVKIALEENELIIQDYGLQKTKKTWSKKKIKLANGSAIAAVGAGQSLRGIKDEFTRPTHVICDDLLKDDEVESNAMRNKIYNWFKRVILNLGKGALTIIANTIMHPDDLPSRLLKEIEDGTLENWLGLRFSAVLPDDTGHLPKDITLQCTPLWPERWPMKDIVKKRRNLGAAIFATEWLNQAVSEEDKKFKKDWIEYYGQLPLDVLKRLKIIMAVDPATGTVSGDFSAVIVVGYDPESGVYYVLHAFIERISDLQLAYKVVEIWKMYKTKAIWFEDRVFQKIYKKEVARAAKKMGVTLPLKGFAGGNKDLRIQSLSPLVENGLIQFKTEQKCLVDQLLGYPKEHDDGPDALEMCISKLDSGGGFVGGSASAQQKMQSLGQQVVRFATSVFGGEN